MKKDTIKELSIDDLLKYEKASEIVCKQYEAQCKNYDGSLTNGVEYKIFSKYNEFRIKIIEEIRMRIDNIM